MAKASKTGTYKVGRDFYHFNEGDTFPEFPRGVKPEYAGESAQIGNTAEDEDARMRAEAEALAAAEDTRAKGKAPENR
jgi:hypothetical protein